MSDSTNQLKYLVESLGKNGENYLYFLRLWFKMLITKEELDRELRKFLSNELISSHNNLVLSILKECCPIDYQSDHFIQPFFFEPFTPISSLQYDVGEREGILQDERYFVMHERVLPDRKFIMRRMHHNALESGLRGSTIASADLLVLATQHFLKNILTAVISRRKGYRTNYNKFIHSISEPIANPWLKNVSKHRPAVSESLRCEIVGNEKIILPGKRLSWKQIEHEYTFKSASQASGPLLPISLIDLFVTLNIYPSIIASDFLYTITRERIIAKIDHPTFDK